MSSPTPRRYRWEIVYLTGPAELGHGRSPTPKKITLGDWFTLHDLAELGLPEIPICVPIQVKFHISGIGILKFEISSWCGARVDVRTYLLGGVIDGNEANEIIRDPTFELEISRFTFDLVPLSYESADVVGSRGKRTKEDAWSRRKQRVWNDCRSCKVRVGLNGNLWEASVFLGRKKGCIMDTLKFTAMPFVLTNAPAVFMELMSRMWKESNGNEPILALPEEADDFVVYYDARSKDLEACLEKKRRIALLESQNTSYHPMLQFIKNSCIYVALTKLPSVYYPKLLREFWYTAEADAVMKTISFTLSCFDKPLSFDPGVFSSIIRLNLSENCVSVPPKETVNGGLATLGLFDEKHPHLSSTDLINSSLVRINHYFKPTFENEVALTAHICKVVALSPSPIKSLIPPSKAVNADDTVATADATKSLDASESAEEQVNQPKTAKAEKGMLLLTSSWMKLISRIRLFKNTLRTHIRHKEDHTIDTENITFLGPGPIGMELYDSDSGLRSMPDDDLVSLIGIKTLISANQEYQYDHQDIAANLNTSLVGGDDYNLNAFDDVPALSDPLSHLRKELYTLSTKVDQLELNISKKVSKDIRSFVPLIVADSIKSQLRGFLSEAFKECLPLIQDSIHQALQ
ncbi:hypothetical protein Tco_0709994 [Tanacetum coccineum]